jgi:PAS domain S-box-containing protein
MHPVGRGAELRSGAARLAHLPQFALAGVTWAPFATAVVAFGVDLLTPRAIVDFYLVPILVCLRVRSARVPLYVAALCTPLMLIGYQFAPQGNSTETVSLINRFSALAVVWIAAMMISSMLRSSAAAREAQATARLSERRFRVMADGVPAMIWVTDALGAIEFVNREYCAYFGVTQEQVKGDGWLPLVHPDDAARYVGAYAAALGNRRPFHARVRVRHASGEWRWVESSGVPRFSEAGVFLGYVGLSPDVTSTVEAQRELEQADRRKDEFLAMLSHELRNPLAPIRNAADVLATAGVSPERLQWASGMIRRQAARMAGLLDDLFDVARIAEGKLTLSARSVSFASVADAAIEVARPALDRKNHRLRVRLPAEPAMLRADPLRLSQVFSNLLHNAAKYTDPGGRIELTGTIDGGTLSVSVKDDGIGLPPEALIRVFTLFSQWEGANTRAEGGMGIGLALAKGIVELHGGTIEARSEGYGRGSEFIVHLPLVAAESDSAPHPDSDGAASSTDRRRVLIADDNRDASDSLAMLLEAVGHEVRVAYDGIAALSIARTFRPEMVLLDIDMPGLDGYAVAKALRGEPWGADLTIVAITGWGNEKDRRRALAAGFDLHLTKPVEPDAIRSLLHDRTLPGTPRGETPPVSAGSEEPAVRPPASD